MTQRKHRHDREGNTTHFTHTHLWMAGQWALNRASDNGTVIFDAGLLALIASALATEAYLNYLGPRACISWSPAEDRLTPREKLKLVCRQVEMPLDTDSSAYRAFVRLFALRNRLAHGRPETVKGTWREADFPTGLRQDAEWMKEARFSAAHEIISHVHDLLTELGRQAGEDFGPFERLNEHGARGLMLPPDA